jgi:hypothetical protein
MYTRNPQIKKKFEEKKVNELSCGNGQLIFRKPYPELSIGQIIDMRVPQV